MKLFLIVSGILILIFIIFQIYTAMATTATNAQPYTVIRTELDFEIRFYPPATLATIRSSARTYKDLSGPGFRKLAGYIFGGNESEKKIAMTTPVHMDINDSLSSMSFVMPEEYSLANLPKPKDAQVELMTTEGEYVAAIRFGGFASDAEIQANRIKLENALKASSVSHKGNFRFLGYNPPYQLFGRRNEVVVTVNWK
ncbi:MAG TPA: heme-binding protein [Catalimonadaceae bacterium]|nr:heme-binding protein [Catalimonadaceae bacterium]